MAQCTRESEAPSSERAKVDQIEDLIRELEGESATATGLLREHLEAARFYLLGCMREEYRLSLELAKEILPDIEDEGMRTRIADFLHGQSSEPRFEPEAAEA